MTFRIFLRWTRGLIIFTGVVSAAFTGQPAAAQESQRSFPPLRLSFAGDIMAHDSNFKMRDFSRIYERVKPLLQQTELNFANLEFVIDNERPYSTYPSFNVHNEYVQAAIDAGFNVFSLANNHSTDFGLAGVRATERSRQRLQQQYPELVFSGLRPEELKPGEFVIQQIPHKSWKIGFTAITILSNSSHGIEAIQYIPADDGPRLRAFYRWLEQQRPHYDLLIVSVHGGLEYKLEPSPRKTGIMRQLSRHGADIVWGHHPHVQQSWEIYRGLGDPKRDWSLILYSQGNFISAQTIRTKPGEPLKGRSGSWAATGDSALLQVTLTRDAQGQLQLERLQPLPITAIRLKPFAFGVVPMEDAAGEIRAQGYDGWEHFYAARYEWLKQRLEAWPRIP